MKNVFRCYTSDMRPSHFATVSQVTHSTADMCPTEITAVAIPLSTHLAIAINQVIQMMARFVRKLEEYVN